MIDVTYKDYVKREFCNKFKKHCEINCLDFYGCGCILTAHLVMKDLMCHTFKGVWKGKKVTPVEAWQGAMQSTDFHSACSASFTASIISMFSLRGKEFQKWWNKEAGGTGKEKGTINTAIMIIGGKNERTKTKL